MIWRRRLALAKPIAASAIDCSFWPRQVGSVSFTASKRFGQTGDVAVAEDREDAGKQRLLLAIDDRELVAQIANQGLRHGTANR